MLMHDWSPAAWLAAILAATIAGLSKTGVPGLGLLAVAIFANLLPARQASGFLLPLLIVGDLVAVRAYRQHAEWHHLRRLFLWTGLGVGLGALIMGRLNDRMASPLVGFIVLAFVGWQILKKLRPLATSAPMEHGPWFAPAMGVAAGITTLLANAAGPLMAIYLVAMRLPKLAHVGTAAVFFLLLNTFKVPFMVGLGLIDLRSLTTGALLAPAVLLGAWGGRRLLPSIPQRTFEGVALSLAALAGLRLLAS